MDKNELFRLGLQYLMELEPRGTKAKVASCSRMKPNNFYAGLSGKRPFPEEARERIARCLMLSVRDLERMGMDLTYGVEDSIHMKQVMAKKIIVPEMASMPDLDIFSVNIETLETHLVGEGWTLDNSSVMAQFEKEPAYQARYIFRKKQKMHFEALASKDEGQVEDS